MTLAEWTSMATKALEASGDLDAAFDAKVIAGYALPQKPYVGFRFDPDTVLNEERMEKAQKMLDRRIAGEPLQYIEGFAHFYGYSFSVDPRVLIPRQDTETLVETALDVIRPMKEPRVLELCTGSGAVAISIKRQNYFADVTATDIDDGAMYVAGQNDLFSGSTTRIRLLKGDLFDPVRGRRFDVIVCNPPYLTKDDMKHLQREVRHEPEIALYGGEDGLDFYRRIAGELEKMLTDRGCGLFEVGDCQAKDVVRIFREAMPRARVSVKQDINGKDRVVTVEKGKVFALDRVWDEWQ